MCAVGWNSSDRNAGDRQPQDDHDDLPAGEVAEVPVDRVDGPEQHAPRSSPSRIALLPAVRREHDVHVPDERPDDVVRGELAGREPVDRAALLVARSSSRRRGRSPARRSSRSCRSSSRRGTGTAPRSRSASVVRVEVDPGARLGARSGGTRIVVTARVRDRLGRRASLGFAAAAASRCDAVASANTCSMTSSIGGSSIVRSATGEVAQQPGRDLRGVGARDAQHRAPVLAAR